MAYMRKERLNAARTAADNRAHAQKTPLAGAIKKEVAMHESHTQEPFSVAAADGYRLQGFAWRHPSAMEEGAAPSARPVVIINPATSVRCRYYARFAAFLHGHGFDVLTYDYRGIGESRPATLRGFQASWRDWGRLDCEALLGYATERFPGQPIDVVAHSVGGFVLGLAASNHRVRRVFTMGAQFAYWRDYAPAKRWRMFAKWHLFMPLLTAICGYFPGQRLGWLEDTPRGVVRDWTTRAPRIEEMWRSGRQRLGTSEQQALRARYAALTAPILALSISDDEFGTVAAIERLLACFVNSRSIHVHMAPSAIDEAAIGHFAFFNSRFEQSLWSIPLAWLRDGYLADTLVKAVPAAEPLPVPLAARLLWA